jgi:glucans biosynthesis protein
VPAIAWLSIIERAAMSRAGNNARTLRAAGSGRINELSNPSVGGGIGRNNQGKRASGDRLRVAKLAPGSHCDTRSFLTSNGCPVQLSKSSSLPKFKHAVCVTLGVAMLYGCGSLASKPGTTKGGQAAAPGGAPASTLGTPAHAPPPFFPTLIERARGLSAAPPRPTTVDLPPGLRDIPWEIYRKISYRPERALWRGEPGQFEAQFFHMGYGYREPVAVFVVQGQEAKPFAFSPEQFHYEGVTPPTAEEAARLGFAGVRLHAPINRQDFREEFVVFQGASYFRPVHRGGWLGLSARGLAIDTGLPGNEEFPRFSELYLQRPGPDDKSMWVLALLESKRVTGAYAMRIEPGDYTTVEVHAQLFVREQVGIFGVAPLTSMFLFGEAAPAQFGDYRPEVHDSDTLLMWAGNGERIARSLHNPPRTTACTFRLDSPKGFGLVQRDRSYDHYQDLVEHYHRRPSAWIEPLSDWGPGSVRLLEIATRLESDDNIGAMWVPDQVDERSLNLHYRIHVGERAPIPEPLGVVVGTRHASWDVNRSRFVVDFANVPRTAENAQPRLEASATNGRLAEQRLIRNEQTGGYRAEIDVVREQSDDIELRAVLRDDTGVLTETWSYLWQPTR